MAEYPQKPPLKVQMRHIHFGSQLIHLEESTKPNHPLNRTLVKTEPNQALQRISTLVTDRAPSSTLCAKRVYR